MSTNNSIRWQAGRRLEEIEVLFGTEPKRAWALERQRGEATPWGDAYAPVQGETVYRLETSEGRKAWKAAAREPGDRLIPEDGTAWVMAVVHFRIEPIMNALVCDLMPKLLDGIQDEAAPGVVEDELREIYEGEDSWRAYMDEQAVKRYLQAHEGEQRGGLRIAGTWEQRNRAIAEALADSPGMSSKQLYEAVEPGVTFDTFRRWFTDTRCSYRLKREPMAGNGISYRVEAKAEAAQA